MIVILVPGRRSPLQGPLVPGQGTSVNLCEAGNNLELHGFLSRLLLMISIYSSIHHSFSLNAARQSRRHPHPISITCHAVKSAKRLQNGPQIGQRGGREPKIVEISPGCGEEWKVASVVEMLRNGGVRRNLRFISAAFLGRPSLLWLVALSTCVHRVSMPGSPATMQVGIIPTDTLPAIVADLENRDAIIKLYAIKEMSTKKPLSILCRNFQDISHYTAGWVGGRVLGGSRADPISFVVVGAVDILRSETPAITPPASPSPLGRLPVSNEPGARNWFNVIRKILPGPVRSCTQQLMVRAFPVKYFTG